MVQSPEETLSKLRSFFRLEGFCFYDLYLLLDHAVFRFASYDACTQVFRDDGRRFSSPPGHGGGLPFALPWGFFPSVRQPPFFNGILFRAYHFRPSLFVMCTNVEQFAQDGCALTTAAAAVSPPAEAGTEGMVRIHPERNHPSATHSSAV